MRGIVYPHLDVEDGELSSRQTAYLEEACVPYVKKTANIRETGWGIAKFGHRRIAVLHVLRLEGAEGACVRSGCLQPTALA